MNYKITVKNNSQPKYLFLDIDGVMNSFDDYKMSGKKFMKNIHKLTFKLSKKQIKLINKIVENYNPKIILSSYWRTRYSLDEINKIFKDKGFKGTIADYTDHKGEEHDDRWNQIKRYIDKNQVKNYIILDDEHITKDSTVVPNFIKTDSYVGLTKNSLKDIHNIWK